MNNVDIIEKRVVIRSADSPNQKYSFDIDVDDVLGGKQLQIFVQLTRSTPMFGTRGSDIFYKGRKLKCEFLFKGLNYAIRRSAYPVLDGDGRFCFFVDKEIVGSTIELNIKDFRHIITFKLKLEKHNPQPTAVCWCKSEKLKSDSKEAESNMRTGNIYPNEDAFLHITTQGMFGQNIAVEVVDSKGRVLSSNIVKILKNNGVAIFSMEELKRAFYRLNSKDKSVNTKFNARVNAVEIYDSEPLTLVLDGKLASAPAKASPQMGTAKAMIGDKESQEREEHKKKNLKIALFFDGTSNNKDNVEARELYTSLNVDKSNYKQVYANTQDDKERRQLEAYHNHGKDDSYQNDKSNVAKLWDSYKTRPKSVYVEGIGTEQYEGDDFFQGTAIGVGSNGIVAKVKNGINEIQNRLKKTKIKTFDSISIDVYGFSRGAAAARHFIAEVTQNGVLGRTPPYGKLGKLFQENDITVKRLIIRFTGLFDTVSSHGTNFSDDVETLQLHKVSKSRYTVQLAAADEYRKNFALTRIGSCGGRGLELFLPGAHADIGGGYRTNDDKEQSKLIYESSNKKNVEKLRKELIDEGWYLENQITLSEQIRFHINGGYSTSSYYYFYSLRGSRSVSNSYAHVPLHIMQELTDKYTREEMFDVKKINLQYKIVGLSAVYTALKKYVDDENKVDTINTYASYCNTLELKELRNKHLHWSATPDMVHAPNVENEKFIRIRHEDN